MTVYCIFIPYNTMIDEYILPLVKIMIHVFALYTLLK